MIIYLNESIKDEYDKAGNKISIFYEHCLKWIYQPNRQGNSWIKSIVENAKDVYKIIRNKKGVINKNILREVNSNLYDSYLEGLNAANEAVKEANINIKKLAKDEEIFNTFNSVEKITDLDFLRDWMLENAYSDEVVTMVENKFRLIRL